MRSETFLKEKRFLMTKTEEMLLAALRSTRDAFMKLTERKTSS